MKVCKLVVKEMLWGRAERVKSWGLLAQVHAGLRDFIDRQLKKYNK